MRGSRQTQGSRTSPGSAPAWDAAALAAGPPKQLHARPATMAERPPRRAPPARALLLALAGALLAPHAARGKSPVQAAARASSSRHLDPVWGLRVPPPRLEETHRGASAEPPARVLSASTPVPCQVPSPGVGDVCAEKTLDLGSWNS